MIEKTLKTTLGKLEVKIPSQLNEVTLGQMIDMHAKTDLKDIEAISILSGIPVEELNQVKNMHDFREFGDAILLLAYQLKYLFTIEKIPERLIFNLSVKNQSSAKQVTVKVLQNLSIEPAGAFMAARDVITNEINKHIETHGEEDWQESFNPSLNACCQVLAHYLYCRVTGKKYIEYQVEEFVNEIKKLRVTEALPVAKHFFTCYPNLSKPRISFWQRLLMPLKKEQVYNHSKGLSISTP